MSGFVLLSGLETLEHTRKIKLMVSPEKLEKNKNVTVIKNTVENIVAV